MARRKLKDMVLCILEVVYSLSTDSFIMSFRRFVECRGNVRMIIDLTMVQTLLGHQQSYLVYFKRWIISR